MMESHYEMSKEIAQSLLKLLAVQPPGTLVAASGTSCRHQLADLAGIKALHLVEVLARAL